MSPTLSPYASSKKILDGAPENEDLKRLYIERVNQQAKMNHKSSPFGEPSAT